MAYIDIIQPGNAEGELKEINKGSLKSRGERSLRNFFSYSHQDMFQPASK